MVGEILVRKQILRKLEAFRHEKAKEIERLRAEIDGALSAKIRAQEKEFEGLTRCWEAMNKALGQAESFVSPLQSYQDLSKMSDDFRAEYVDKLEILEAKKKEILQSEDPTSALVDAVFWMKLNRANEALREFNNELFRFEIFLEVEIHARFMKIMRQVRSAIVSKELSRDAGEGQFGRQAWEELTKQCKPHVDELTDRLRSRFVNRSGNLDLGAG